VDPLIDATFEPPPRLWGEVGDIEQALSALPALENEHRVTLVDGRLITPFPSSPPPGVEIHSLAEVLRVAPEIVRHQLAAIASETHERHQPFVDLNTAVFQDGVLLFLRAGAKVVEPLHLVFASPRREASTLCHPRLLVVAEPNAEATLVETYLGDSGATYFTNAVTEVALGEGARLRHLRLQLEGDLAFHIASLAVQQERGSTYDSHVVSFGSRLARLDLRLVLEGPGAEAALDGLFVASGEQHLDHHTLVDHRAERGTSRQQYRGILAGRARTVFDGLVRVRPGAQATNAQQEIRHLLLSEGALAHAKPSLEIEADQVRVSHGATVGELDPDPLFYLRSRGIDEAVARSMLVQAFAEAVLTKVPGATMRRFLTARALERLSLAPAEEALS
jgi:Fe-S cluster assembly protein SufD